MRYMVSQIVSQFIAIPSIAVYGANQPPLDEKKLHLILLPLRSVSVAVGNVSVVMETPRSGGL